MALILHDATEARQKTFEAIESERIQALTLLAASVAHEIGNPLNALHIHLQLMERESKRLKQAAAGFGGATLATPKRSRSPAFPTGEDTAEIAGKLENYLTVAKGEIARLDYIVTQFLQAIRPTPPQKKLVSLNDIARETIELLRPEIENRGQTIEDKLARQLPSAPLDPAQIKQVLVNLLKNAMQAMSKGGMLNVQTGSGADGVWISGFRNIRHLHVVVYPLVLALTGYLVALRTRSPLSAAVLLAALLAFSGWQCVATAQKTQIAFADRRTVCRYLLELPPKPSYADQGIVIWCTVLDPTNGPPKVKELPADAPSRKARIATITSGYVVTGGAREPYYGCPSCITSASELPAGRWRLVQKFPDLVPPVPWREEALRVWEAIEPPAARGG